MRNAIFAMLALGALFAALDADSDRARQRLAQHKPLLGEQISETPRPDGNIPLTGR